MIHYARLDHSPRLQRLLAYLQDHKPHSTMDIITGAGICAVNSAVSEIRRNGYNVECIGKGKNQNGSNVFEYRLLA